MKTKLIILGMLLCLFSCQDDDVCVDESTPNLVILIQDKTTLERITLDTLFIEYVFAENDIDTVKYFGVDSVQVPLRIDNQAIGLGVITSFQTNKDSLSLQYTPAEEYVSKACGLKKIYNQISFIEENITTLDRVEVIQNNITTSNESHSIFYY